MLQGACDLHFLWLQPVTFKQACRCILSCNASSAGSYLAPVKVATLMLPCNESCCMMTVLWLQCLLLVLMPLLKSCVACLWHYRGL